MSPPPGPLVGLRRLTRPAPPAADHPAPVEVCEMCSAKIAPRHGHVADLQSHRLLCACRSCFLLFTEAGAGAGRFRALPESSRRVVEVALSEGQWDALQIPVDLAFFFRQSGGGSFAACYPGPGGATESLLDLASWALVCTANPALAQVQPDVEAILLRRVGGSFECYLVPIDRCYELVGAVRQSWVGFSGGPQARARIDGFFDELQAASHPVDRLGRAVGRA